MFMAVRERPHKRRAIISGHTPDKVAYPTVDRTPRGGKSTGRPWSTMGVEAGNPTVSKYPYNLVGSEQKASLREVTPNVAAWTAKSS
jgi:hypothetical protein